MIYNYNRTSLWVIRLLWWEFMKIHSPVRWPAQPKVKTNSTGVINGCAVFGLLKQCSTPGAVRNSLSLVTSVKARKHWASEFL
jgi:hypothetical protein